MLVTILANLALTDMGTGTAPIPPQHGGIGTFEDFSLKEKERMKRLIREDEEIFLILKCWLKAEN